MLDERFVVLPAHRRHDLVARLVLVTKGVLRSPGGLDVHQVALGRRGVHDQMEWDLVPTFHGTDAGRRPLVRVGPGEGSVRIREGGCFFPVPFLLGVALALPGRFRVPLLVLLELRPECFAFLGDEVDDLVDGPGDRS